MLLSVDGTNKCLISGAQPSLKRLMYMLAHHRVSHANESDICT